MLGGGVVGTSMFTKDLTFLGSTISPSLDTMKPKIVLENTMNAHLSQLRLIPNFTLKFFFGSISR